MAGELQSFSGYDGVPVDTLSAALANKILLAIKKNFVKMPRDVVGYCRQERRLKEVYSLPTKTMTAEDLRTVQFARSCREEE